MAGLAKVEHVLLSLKVLGDLFCRFRTMWFITECFYPANNQKPCDLKVHINMKGNPDFLFASLYEMSWMGKAGESDFGLLCFCRVTWCASAEATTSRASPWSRACWPTAVCACCSARDTPATVPAGQASANASLCVAASLMPTSAFWTWSSSRKVTSSMWFLWTIMEILKQTCKSTDFGWIGLKQQFTFRSTSFVLWNKGTPVDPFWLVCSHKGGTACCQSNCGAAYQMRPDLLTMDGWTALLSH